MKKIFYLASIAALAFSSCTKDETTDANLGTVTNGSKIVAAMEADDTRTELVKNGNAYDIVWKSTDGLSVYEKASSGTTSAFSNRLFQLDNASDGLASGAFTGSKLTAGGTYVAVYPYDKAYTFSPNWNYEYYKTNSGSVTMLDPESISVNIPAEQEYVGSGTFNTNTIPAVSTSFVVGEDGNATVKMQPVVDYVMVDIVATEPINNISLRLFNGPVENSNSINIAGTTPLKAYYNGGIRYVTANTDLTGNTITLVTKDLADDVSLAKANTYVFAIPGGILGMNGDVQWVLYVNGEASKDYAFLSSSAAYNQKNSLGNDDNEYNINTMLNSFPIGGGYTASRIHYATSYTTTDIQGNTATHKENGYSTYLEEYSSNLENTVFYLNASDAEGKPMPFTYNPNGDKLIQDELDLLDYISNYDDESQDAYVAEGAIFDLSISNLSALLREEGKNVSDNLRTVINNYIMPNGTFPVIEKFENEFLGNGATIANIERPLAEMTGLFGELTEDAVISNLTLSNIDAATKKVNGEIVKGYVLGSDITEGAISGITVSELNADAVVGAATVAQYKKIAIGEDGIDEELNHIVDVLTMGGDLSYSAEAWAAVSGVNESVFHTIVPAADDTNAYNNVTYNNSHSVATLPAGAEYSKFVEEVDYEEVAENTVVSVLIDGVSYWTGGKIDSAADNTYDAYPATILIQYAEQLVNGKRDSSSDHMLTRDMNFEYVVLGAAMDYLTLNGGGNTVTGLNYVVDQYNASTEIVRDAIAPFKGLTEISDITFDGLTVAVSTDGDAKIYVPQYISGLANELKDVDGVTINNLVFDAYSEASDNTITDADYLKGQGQRYLGWLSATAEDIYVNESSINGVESNVLALTAMVARLDLKSNNSFFNEVSVNGIEMNDESENISDFEYFTAGSQYNLAGTLVGYARNHNSKRNVGIKFDDCTPTKPVFLYQTTKGYVINVLYNDTVEETLLNPADED